MYKVMMEFAGIPGYTKQDILGYSIDYFIAHSYLLMYMNNPKEYNKMFADINISSGSDILRLFS